MIWKGHHLTHSSIRFPAEQYPKAQNLYALVSEKCTLLGVGDWSPGKMWTRPVPGGYEGTGPQGTSLALGTSFTAWDTRTAKLPWGTPTSLRTEWTRPSASLLVLFWIHMDGMPMCESQVLLHSFLNSFPWLAKITVLQRTGKFSPKGGNILVPNTSVHIRFITWIPPLPKSSINKINRPGVSGLRRDQASLLASCSLKSLCQQMQSTKKPNPLTLVYGIPECLHQRRHEPENVDKNRGTGCLQDSRHCSASSFPWLNWYKI